MEWLHLSGKQTILEETNNLFIVPIKREFTEMLNEQKTSRQCKHKSDESVCTCPPFYDIVIMSCHILPIIKMECVNLSRKNDDDE